MASDKVNYAEVGAIAQAMKYQIRTGGFWDELPGSAKESLDQIATAIARIVAGDGEHWDAIIGYAHAAKPTIDDPGRQAIEDWKVGKPEKMEELERGMRGLVRELPSRNDHA